MSKHVAESNSEGRAQIVIANDLRSGLTVFLTSSGGWSGHITDARVVFDVKEAGNALLIAEADEASNKVTGVYLADCNEHGAPLVLRELLRVEGPSVDYMPVHLTTPLYSSQASSVSEQTVQGEN